MTAEKKVDDSGSNSSDNAQHIEREDQGLQAPHAGKPEWWRSMSTSSKMQGMRPDGKREIQEWECYDKLGYSFPTWKKWWVIIMVFTVQVSHESIYDILY